MAARSVARSGSDDDLDHGQIVIITTRWILVVAGLLFALWNPAPIAQLRVQIAGVLALAALNFYLHAQVLMRRPVSSRTVYAASVADVCIITLLILMQRGFASQLYVFYLPAIVAFSVAFRPATTFAFAAGTIALYTIVSVGSLIGTPAPLAEGDVQVLVARLLMMAAVAACGGLYRQIEGDRRGAAARGATTAVGTRPSAVSQPETGLSRRISMLADG